MNFHQNRYEQGQFKIAKISSKMFEDVDGMLLNFLEVRAVQDFEEDSFFHEYLLAKIGVDTAENELRSFLKIRNLE